MKNQARFIEEIIDNKLIVSKKKKAVLVQELRDRKYEAFPKGEDAKKARSTDEDLDQDEADAEEIENDGGTRDYDYLLSVRTICYMFLLASRLTLILQMPIWALTMERLERLKKQIAAKKAEHDDLECLSEKDLWCNDLDAFLAEWHTQVALDAEIQTSIRRMGRRVSKKIGAGKGRRARDDDDYNPTKPKATAKAAKAVVKVEPKAHERFATIFGGKPKAKPATNTVGHDGASDPPEPASDFSDDDYAALSKKPAKKPSPAESVSDVPAAPAAEDAGNGRTKRAAASKAKTWVMDDDDSESDDDDKMLGDVGAMVRGIGEPATNTANGRLSLFAMSRPESSHGNAASNGLSRGLKPKPSRTFDFDSHDDTNYEMLARSSPAKSPKKDDVDSFLSDDDLPVVTKVTKTAKASSSSAAISKAPLSVVPAAKKGRGRPAGTKNKTKTAEPVKSKPAHLSPAAKAYAAKKASKPKKTFFSDDEDDDDVAMEEPPSPVVSKARGRPARAATVTKAKPIYIDDDEEDSLVMDDNDDEESDVYAMDDSD